MRNKLALQHNPGLCIAIRPLRQIGGIIMRKPMPMKLGIPPHPYGGLGHEMNDGVQKIGTALHEHKRRHCLALETHRGTLHERF